ncbi:hypothetical protein N2152v2_001449 [Parachlorella kessleri]
MEPAPGVHYPLVLGPTLLGKRKTAEYCSLRYDFLPASVAKAGQGHFEVQADSQVSLQLPSTAGAPLHFAGRQEPSKDGLDCVAIFDGTQFRLEVLHASIKGLRQASGLLGVSVSETGQAAVVPAVPGAAGRDTPQASPASTPASPPVPAPEEDEDLEQALFEHLNDEDDEGEQPQDAQPQPPLQKQHQEQIQRSQQARAAKEQQPQQLSTVHVAVASVGQERAVERAQEAVVGPAGGAVRAAIPAAAASPKGPSSNNVTQSRTTPPAPAAVLAASSPPVTTQNPRQEQAQPDTIKPVAPAPVPPPAMAAPARVLPNTKHMSELDLEFFGDMVAPHEAPGNGNASSSDGSSSEEDESSSDDEKGQGAPATGAAGIGPGTSEAGDEEFI